MCHKHTAIIPGYTAYPCEVSCDALIQTNNISVERLMFINQTSMLLVNEFTTN